MTNKKGITISDSQLVEIIMSTNVNAAKMIEKFNNFEKSRAEEIKNQKEINEKNENRIKCLETFQIKSVAAISAIGVVAGFIGAVVKEFLPFLK